MVIIKLLVSLRKKYGCNLNQIFKCKASLQYIRNKKKQNIINFLNAFYYL